MRRSCASLYIVSPTKQGPTKVIIGQNKLTKIYGWSDLSLAGAKYKPSVYVILVLDLRLSVFWFFVGFLFNGVISGAN